MNPKSAVESLCDGDLPDRYLVGRSGAEQEIASKLVERHQCVWLSGARGVGKTALGERIARAVLRDGVRVLQVSVAAAHNFEDLCNRVADAGAAAGIAMPPSAPAAEQLDAIATAAGKFTLVIVFDDFDAAAMSLDVAAQASLRALAENTEHLAYLLITRQSPTRLLEEVVENSRLAGICTWMPVRPLKRVDVVELFVRLAEDLGAPDVETAARSVWDQVAGFPVLVKEIASFIARHRLEGQRSDLEEIIVDALDRSQEGLRIVWRSIHPDLRAALARDQSGKIGDVRWREAGLNDRRTGVVRPRALIEFGRLDDEERRGRVEPVSTSALERCDVIQRKIYEVNTGIKAVQRRDGFKASHEHLSTYSLCRVPCEPAVFKDCIEYIYKLLWESTREGSGGEAQSLLPESLSKLLSENQASRDVNTLRNGLFHDKSKPTDARKNNPDLIKFHDVFERLCGVRMPIADEDYARARDALLDGVVDLLFEMHAQANILLTAGTSALTVE